jgi:hypothetical protein
VAHIVPTFIELTTVKRLNIELVYTKFQPDRPVSKEGKGRNTFTPLSSAQVSMNILL